MISVLLVDDHPLIRKGFRLVLSAEADIEVAGEAADGRTAVAMCSALRRITRTAFSDDTAVARSNNCA